MMVPPTARINLRFTTALKNSYPKTCQLRESSNLYRLSRTHVTNSNTTSNNTQQPASSSAPGVEVPPLMIYQTASPNVYVSSAIIDDSENNLNHESTSQAPLHPKNFFQSKTLPPFFQKNQSRFEYVPPKTFQHEMPTAQIPEVAFLGRSNVGKSSLINAITRGMGRKVRSSKNKKNKRNSNVDAAGKPTNMMARISKRPGRTQLVNYFALLPNSSSTASGNTITNHSTMNPYLYLIDLPGYGFAKAPVDKVDQWQETTQEFLLDRQETGSLKRLYLLIDSRRGLSMTDQAIMSWMDEASIPYTLVLTKQDTVSRGQVVKLANEMAMRFHSQYFFNVDAVDASMVGGQGPFVHVTSSQDGRGVADLIWAICNDCSI